MLYAGIAIIFNKNKEVLIVKRSPEVDTFSGYWCFPGGGADPWETPEECTVREVKEETNLTIKPDDLSYLHTLTKDEGKEIYFFIAEKYKGDIKIDWESSEFKWSPAGALKNERFIPTPDILFEMIELWADKFISNKN